jgi:hypothetical protein
VFRAARTFVRLILLFCIARPRVASSPSYLDFGSGTPK